MSKQYYQTTATEQSVWDDPVVTSKTDLQSQLAAFSEIATLGDELRGFLAQGGVPGLGIHGGWPDLSSFDTYLGDEVSRLSDILDYFDYSTATANLTVVDGMWQSPDSVHSFSSENVGDEAVQSIDGNDLTFWQAASSPAWIIVKLRDYKKRAKKIRLYTTATDLRTQLHGVTVKGALTIENLDTNVLATGLSFTHVGTDWIEAEITDKNLNFLKLEIDGSLNASGVVRVRELEIWTGIINHDK